MAKLTATLPKHYEGKTTVIYDTVFNDGVAVIDDGDKNLQSCLERFYGCKFQPTETAEKPEGAASESKPQLTASTTKK